MKLFNYFTSLMLAIVLMIAASCTNTSKKGGGEKLSIDYQKYTLDNGLQVILHQDKSDPIVSLAILYHVGSNREKPQRTGFAHLFEHMLFQQSENVGQDQFFKKIQDAGGTLNGGTFEDGTVYYEMVPKNAMEMVLWLESDRMGFFKNTITQGAFANQQDVVINEKRQRVDNNPYGHTNYVIHKAIFPEGHPYNWQVIGEMEDLKNATVDDVREFYNKFYGPNNATLVLAGDFEFEDAKGLIGKYFGEIKKGTEVDSMQVQNVTISETKKLYHEDNFAKAPQLNMVWPTVQQYHPDAYALDFLAKILSDGKKAPLYKVLVKEKELTSQTSAYNSAMELAGLFRINITANEGKSLDDIEKAIFEAFKKFETEGITETDIERVKAGLETGFYNNLQSILNKSFQLAFYSVYAGDPSFASQDIENIRAVTIDDVMRVYNKYIKDKPFVVTSFVPKGQLDMIVEGSEKATVVEEEVTEIAQKQEVKEEEEPIEKTPSEIDRSKEPAQGNPPGLNIPEVWTAQLDNGMKVYGVENGELPLINFNIVLDGGHLLDDKDKVGVANLMTDIMMEGTANKTPEELEEEIELLGSNIWMYTSGESITIAGNTLVRNFDKTLDLIEEILFEPRWDTTEFARIKIKTINQIKRDEANPGSIARKVYNKLIYGEDHIMAYPAVGTVESVEKITIDDLKAFYDKYYSPSVARFHVVGKISKDNVLASLQDWNTKWEAKEVVMPEYTLPESRGTSELYFYDFPGAKQSVVMIGYLGLSRSDPDFYPAEVMNYKLGGSFSGNLNLILREEKGYTYGARSYFSGGKIPGSFTATASVQTNATLESVEVFIDEMNKYREGISAEDLDFTKNALIKSNALRFETLSGKLGMLTEMSAYNLSPDYVRDEENVIRNMTLDQHKELAQKYVDPKRMVFLIVGDAETQYDRLKTLKFDKVYLDKGEKEETPEENTIM